MTVVPLAEATDSARYGGKAAQLAAAMVADLPVPPGVALAVDVVEAVAAEAAHAVGAVANACVHLARPLAVRSSAVGEDSEAATFAGQHVTRLNVRSDAQLLAAVREIHASASSEAARRYRRRLELPGVPRIAVVVQELVAVDRAGVLFTRHPLTGADERVIEASWGLGEAVVAGLVIPDRYRLTRDGRVLAREPGDKRVALRLAPEGGTVEDEVEPALVGALCLDDTELARLNALAGRVEAVFGGAHDLEWAFQGEALWLLQRRPITQAAR